MKSVRSAIERIQEQLGDVCGQLTGLLAAEREGREGGVAAMDVVGEGGAERSRGAADDDHAAALAAEQARAKAVIDALRELQTHLAVLTGAPAVV